MEQSRHHQAFLPCPAPLGPPYTLPVCPGVQVQLNSGLPRHKNGGYRILTQENQLKLSLDCRGCSCIVGHAAWLTSGHSSGPVFPFLSACQRRAYVTAAWWSVSVGSVARGSCVSVRGWSRGSPPRVPLLLSPLCGHMWPCALHIKLLASV